MFNYGYAHEKVIRLPITENMVQKAGFENSKEFIKQFKHRINEKCPELSYRFVKQTPYFEAFETIEINKHQYIDLVLYGGYKEYECNTGWAKASYLSDKEKELFASYFNKLDIDYDIDDLRKADYCWCVCCDPPDCYDVNEDDWTTLIGIEGY